MEKKKQILEKRAIVSGLVVNVILFFFKLAAGIFGGSAALVADSVHTITDVATDIAVLIGSKYWHEPPDKKHMYGHGRIETVISFGIGLILAFTALQLVISATTTLISGSHTQTEFWTIWIAGFAIIFKEVIFFYTLQISKITNSMALKANAWHHRADSISTIPVILTIYLTSMFPALWWVDPIGVLLIAVFIFKASYDISKPAFDQLVDTGADAKIINQIEGITSSIPKIHCICDVKTRYVGASLLADFTVKIDSKYSVVQSHEISHKTRDKLISEIPELSDANIHIEPID